MKVRKQIAVATATLALTGAFAVVPSTAAFAAYSCGRDIAANNYMYSGYYAGTTIQPSSSGLSQAGIEAQCLLTRRGYSLTVDGVFGPNSQSVAKTFQRKMNSAYGAGLSVDGKIGPATWPYLRNLNYYN